MRLAVAAMLVALCVGATQAQQADPVAAFRAKVEAATQQLDADPQGAAEALDHLAVDSIELRRTRALSAAERDVHARLFLVRGRAHLQLLDNARAEESFRELLRVSPSFSGDLSPLEQQVVDGLRQKEGGVLEVTSTVKGARVLVDGVEVGVTGDAPVRVPLIAGAYELRLDKARFKPASARVTIVAGQTTTSAELVPVQNVPPVAILADREGIDITIDNVSVGRTQRFAALRAQLTGEESAALERLATAAKLDPQTAAGVIVRQPALDRAMTMRAHRECFVDASRALTLTSTALDTMDPADPLAWLGDGAVVRLAPDVGTVRIASTPSDADVFLDGQLVGRTPFERDVCAGAHRIRVRHRIGSYNIAATITRGRTEAIDVPLKPDVAFLGAVDGAGTPVPELTTAVDRALASGLSTYHLASKQELPPEVRPWSDALTGELVAAALTGDRDLVTRLQKQAGTNYDAPLLIAAVRRDGAAVELLAFWNEHTAVDRIAVPGTSDKELAVAVEQLNAPLDVTDLVYRNDVGLRTVDTGLPTASLLIVAVQAGSSAEAAGLKAGDAVVAADRASVTAVQLGEKVASRKPGELLPLTVRSGTGATRDVALSVQRVPRRAPAFDTHLPGNMLLAKLTARSLVATTPAERDLVTFSLAATYMRFGEWRRAQTLLASLTTVPRGEGVGPGMAKYLTARCLEELGERDAALALYTEAATADGDVATDDGATVAMLARYRLSALSGKAG